MLESMGLKHMAHALFSSNKDGKTASTSDGKTASTSDGKTACEVDEGSSSSDEDEFSRQQTHHENGDPPIITNIYEEASTEERKKKRVQMIKKNEGNRIPVVVLPEMRAFCGTNASCVANEFGVQIRRICPTEGFAHSWNSVDSTITDEDIAEDSELIEVVSDKKGYKIYKDWKYAMRKHNVQMKEEGLDAFAHPYPGVTNTGWRYLIDNIFDDEKFEANLERVRDEGIVSGNPLTGEELSRIVLKPNKPSSYSSKSDAKRLAQEQQIQELRAEIEESKKKDEERDQEIANLKILVAQLMNGGGGNNHSSCCSAQNPSPASGSALLISFWQIVDYSEDMTGQILYESTACISVSNKLEGLLLWFNTKLLWTISFMNGFSSGASSNNPASSGASAASFGYLPSFYNEDVYDGEHDSFGWVMEH
ncbi:hypothetical protein Dimus_003916 [Dionaea muscipula]